MSRHIFVLTGAGLSAESGLGTFRDKGGIWAQYDLTEVATPEGFTRDPQKVHDFYNLRRLNLREALHNEAHIALAELQSALAAKGGALHLVTQNIDDLLERAGATDILHMHGELLMARCAGCGETTPHTSDLGLDHTCPSCRLKGGMRPHVVWFGEIPLFMEEIAERLSNSDTFVSIGTSGSVYPAAGFVSEAHAQGLETIEINLEPSDNAHVFLDGRYGPATVEVPRWAREIIASL